MGRRNRTPRKVGPLQALHDREQRESETAPIVNPFAEQQGDYEKNLRFVRNRGGTAIDRWINAKLLSDSQQAGILHCQHLWAKLGSQSVVVDLQRVRGQDNGEGWTQHEALAALSRIKDWFPFQYWCVFEMVCRFDEPAGVAGSRLANVKSGTEVIARTAVCFVADIIAMRERLSY